MDSKKVLLTFIVILFTMHSASSQIPTLRVTDYGWIESVPILKPVLDNYLQQVENDLNQTQPINNPRRLMQGTANSTAIASRGMGSNYGPGFEKLSFGVALGVGVDREEDVGFEDEISGIGAAQAFTFGIKLKERLNAYANVGGVSHSRTLTGILDSDLEAEISTFNIGAHLSYDLKEGSGDSWWGWGGIRTTVGYEYNYNELTFVNVLNEDLELDTGAGVIQGRLKGAPRYKIESSIHSFPMEISSNLRFLKLFTLFGGAAVDLNIGKSKGSGDVDANLTSPLVCSSGICTNLNLPEVRLQGNLDAEEKADPFFFRVFTGLQISISKVSIFGQINQAMRTKVVGANVGVRVAF